MEELGSRETTQWYERDFTLEDAMGMIQGSMKSAVRNYVAVGFYLKAIRDRKLFEEAGYRNFEEFVRDKYGKDKGWASKCIKVNDRLSKDGNAPLLAEGYKEYNVSQLVELAAMTDGQRAQATPETSVREMKRIRSPKPEEPEKVATLQLPEKAMGHFTDGTAVIPQQTEPQISEAQQPLSAHGTPKLVYPEGSLAAMKGCEGGHGCSSCHLECSIRQEGCYCVEAPMGNPFPCTAMDATGSLRAEIGSRCQFIDLELAYRRAGDHGPVPCCKECSEMCGYRCGRSEQPGQGQGEPEAVDAEFSEAEETEEENLTDLQLAWQELERAERLLRECLKELPDESNIHIRRMKIKAAALESYARTLDDSGNEPPKPEQPELPILRNNGQRAAFVDAYGTWPLWIETVETGERYHRYDLADGTSMVVKVYHARLYDYGRTGLPWEERYTEGYGRHEYYLLEPGKFFRDCEANRPALVDKLKEIQKKG